MTLGPELKKISRYEVRASIGSGAYGAVYLAYDPALDTNVAIKILQRADSPGSVRRFQSEAKAAAKLQHRNIARVMDFGQSDGKFFMVMEYLEGQSLEQAIKRYEKVAYEDALGIFIQICEGMARAHDLGIIHRDLKPSNVYLINGPDDEVIVKILDFGVAKLQEEDQKLTNTGSVVGSPLYMSPEQARGQSVDARSDIYSLGCLMHEVLTGEPPVRGTTALDTISMKLNETPSLAKNKAGIKFPDSLVNIVDSCLNPDPRMRPASMPDLLKLLESVELPEQPSEVNSQANSRSSDSTAKETQSAKAGLPKTAVSLLVVLSLGLAALIFFWPFLLKTPDTKPEAVSHPINPETRHVIATGDVQSTDEVMGYLDHSDEPFLLDKVGVHLRASCTDSDIPLVLRKLSRQSRASVPLNLFLDSCKISDTSYALLQQVPFNSIFVDEVDITDGAFRHLCNIRTMHHLKYAPSASVRHTDLKLLKNCQNLTNLDFEGNSINDEDISYLFELKHLVILSLSGNSQLTDKCVPDIKRIKTLKSLGVKNLKGITADGIMQLHDMPNLTDLQFEAITLTDSSVESLKTFPRLRKLDVEHATLTKKQFLKITELTTLEVLNLDAGYLDVDCFRSLEKLRALKELCIYRMDNSAEKLNLVAKLPIRSLKLYNCALSDEQLKLLRPLKLDALLMDGCMNTTREEAEKLVHDINQKWKTNCLLQYRNYSEHLPDAVSL